MITQLRCWIQVLGSSTDGSLKERRFILTDETDPAMLPNRQLPSCVEETDLDFVPAASPAVSTPCLAETQRFDQVETLMICQISDQIMVGWVIIG